MSGWGNANTSTNAPSWHSVSAGSNANGATLFVNVTPGSFGGANGMAVGVFPISVATAQSLRSGIGPGWNLMRQFAGPVATLAISAVGASYGNLACGLVSNGTTNAEYFVTVNATGNVQTVSLVTPGAGFTNTGMLKFVLPANGMVKANISVPGIGYTNLDFVTFSNGVTNAVASLTTNSIGAITTVTFTLGGGGFDGTAAHAVPTITSVGGNTVTTAHITAGGTTYSNGDVVSFSNGVTNATATVSTNATGGISSLTFTNIGSGFDGVTGDVVVSVANSTGGATSGSGATVTANSFGPLNGSIVANSTSFAAGSGLTLTATLGGRAGRVTNEILAFVKGQTGNSAIPT